MGLLRVVGLAKAYDGFRLEDISFALEPGYIMGFIGRNGAGKTTTIKAMLGLVRPDAGQTEILGEDYASHELELKQHIGLSLGAVVYYPRTPLQRLTAVYKRFYDSWDEATYQGYLTRFELDPAKQVQQLSAGMRVKYALALALSHGARLLILDEPTSGLDPVSRDDLLDVFRSVIESGERSILFSTHITSDLEKCADYITYIRQGQLVASAEREDFLDAYRLVRGGKDQLDDAARQHLIGLKETDYGFSGLISARDGASFTGYELERPDIEQIMIYYERSAAGTKMGAQS